MPTPVNRTERTYWLHPLLMAVLIIAMFHFWGNASSVEMEGRSVFKWIGYQWMLEGGDFSHGWMMPVLAVVIVWLKRDELKKAPKRVDWRGLAVVCASLLLHIAAFRAQQPRVSLIALVGVCWGIPFYLYGPTVARLTSFAAGYLLLCFASSLLFFLTFKLRLLASVIATSVLNGVGLESVRRGTAIYSSAGEGFQFNVADPCSGLRSLFVMLALAAPYAYFTLRTRLAQWMLFIASIPLAVVGNITRIVTVGVVAEQFGQEAAINLYHDFSGYLTFAITVLLLVSAGSLINRLTSILKPSDAKANR